MSRPTIIMAAPNGARKVKMTIHSCQYRLMKQLLRRKLAVKGPVFCMPMCVVIKMNMFWMCRYKTLLAGLREQVPDMLVQVTTEAVGVYSPQY